jgi:hypothetical protein
MSEVHITNGALELDDEFSQDVLRGTLDQNSIASLKFDQYQRSEGFRDSEIRALMELYFKNQKVEDISIGMRGETYRREKNDFYLQDPCFVINGRQRLYAAKSAIIRRPSLILRIGAKIYLNSTYESENDMFCAMNSTQQRVSATVLLRNKYKVSAAAKALVDLNENSDFALQERIGWDQKMLAGQCLMGMNLARVAGELHEHKGAYTFGKTYDILASLDNVCVKITPDVFAENVIKFFDVIDEAWGLRNGKTPEQLNRSFLSVLARLVNSYDNFWDADELYFAPKYIARLRKFDSETAIKTMMKNNRGAKEVAFEVLRKQLKLDLTNGRRRPPASSGPGIRPGLGV